ncbi:unnamed protein product [Merluccius merluccius]
MDISARQSKRLASFAAALQDTVHWDPHCPQSCSTPQSPWSVVRIRGQPKQIAGTSFSGSAAEYRAAGQRGTSSARRWQLLKDAVSDAQTALPHGAIEEPLLQATPTATQPSIQQLAVPHLLVSADAPGALKVMHHQPTIRQLAVPSLSGASSSGGSGLSPPLGRGLSAGTVISTIHSDNRRLYYQAFALCQRYLAFYPGRLGN